MALAPDSLERYELVRKIAVGGMAEVFRAKAYGPHGFEKTLAVKRILPEFADDAAFERQFIAEAKLSGRLTHANIVQIHIFGRLAGSLVLAMEYVDGLDLAALLARLGAEGRTLSLGAALWIAVEMLRGLDFAHARDVVHRDVSPSNILLSRAGEVKLTDFGIALAVDQALDRAAVPPMIMGKWRYMSPEQARGERVTPRSDLFSAGVVIHELFTGRKLFPGDQPRQIVDNIEHMPIPDPRESRPELPPELTRILQCALSRDPDDRPARAADIQRSLLEMGMQHRILATAQEVAEAVAHVAPDREAKTHQHGKGIDTLIREQLGSTAAGSAPAVRERTSEGDTPAGRDSHTERAGTDAPAGRDSHTERAGTDTPAGRDSHTERAGTDTPVGREPESRTEPAAVFGHLAVDHRSGDPLGEQSVIVVSGHHSDGLVRLALSPSERAPVSESRTRRRIVPAVLAVVALGIVALGAAAWLTPPAPRALVVDAGVTRPEPDAKAPVAPARLRVDSAPPGARVAIDGRDVGATPLTTEVEPERLLRVELSLAGYATALETIAVAAGYTEEIHSSLTPTRGSLGIATTPLGAQIFIDGQRLGVSPVIAKDLSPGSHRVVAKLAGYRVSSRVVTLSAGEQGSVALALVADRPARPVRTVRTGTLNVAVERSWADIYWNGSLIGRAPVKGLELPVGKQVLELHNPETGKRRRVTVTVPGSVRVSL